MSEVLLILAGCAVAVLVSAPAAYAHAEVIRANRHLRRVAMENARLQLVEHQRVLAEMRATPETPPQ